MISGDKVTSERVVPDLGIPAQPLSEHWDTSGDRTRELLFIAVFFFNLFKLRFFCFVS